MKKSTRKIAIELGLQPISIIAALKILMRGYKPGFCIGIKTKRGFHAWQTK